MPILPRGIGTRTIRSDPNVLVLSQAPLSIRPLKSDARPLLDVLPSYLRGRSKKNTAQRKPLSSGTPWVALLSRFGSAVFFRLSLH